MLRKIYPLLAAIILLLSSCDQAEGTREPIATDPPASNPTQAPAFEGSTQIRLFRLVPADFLGAGFYDLGLIMADPELDAAFEGIVFYPFQDSQLLGSGIDGMVSFSRPAGDFTGAAMSVVHIFYGDFADITLDQLALENEIDGAVFQDYQGFEMLVEEQADPFKTAISVLDEATMVFGEETGVKAVLDTARGSAPAPLADLGAALPPLLMASIFNRCPQYEELGCTAMVVPGLAQGTGDELSFLHVYQFEEPDQAASALEIISGDAGRGNLSQTGSIKISGENISQEGRYVIIEERIPPGEIGAIFEQ
jgi:hypothetical protein